MMENFPKNTKHKSPDFLPQLTACFAQPAAENPTVAMVEAAYQHHGLHFRYMTCEVSPENLEAAVQGAKAMGWAGFNCSLPHKVAVIKHLDQLGVSAKLIGAVNTVIRQGNLWIGENTDGKGFMQSLEGIIHPENKHITIFGAGGAARAIAVEMALAGVSNITIVNRSSDRAEAVVDLLNKHTTAQATYHPWTNNYRIESASDMVINATSLGLYPHVEDQLSIDFDTMLPHMLVADCIPNPPETHLVQTAKAKGCKTIDGLHMLVNQGVLGIKYWTGADVNPAVMHTALKKALGITKI